MCCLTKAQSAARAPTRVPKTARVISHPKPTERAPLAAPPVGDGEPLELPLEDVLRVVGTEPAEGLDVGVSDPGNDAPDAGAEGALVGALADEGDDDAAADEDGGAEEEEVLDGDALAPELVAPAARLPIVLNGVHCEDGGAGCAGGVLGSPWWNVEVPYTPMGSPVSPLQSSNTPAS